MTAAGPHATTRSDGYAVAVPRPTDGIGQALRSLFGRSRLPDDMMVLLSRIDKATG